MDEDHLTTKQRAEHAVERHLAEIAERAPLREEHISKARETLRMYAASEDVATVAAELEQHLDADRIDALVNGDRVVFSEALSTLRKNPPDPARQLALDILALRFHLFSYRPLDTGEGRIYIGLKGEEHLGEDFYSGIAGESAHHLLHTLHHDAHGSISEFYEFALSWWTEPMKDKFFQHGCMDFRLETYLIEALDTENAELISLAHRALADILAEPEGNQQLSTFFWGNSRGYADECDSFFIPTKMSSRLLEEEILDYFQLTLARMSFYSEAHAIGGRLLKNIMSSTGMSLEEAHDAVTIAAVEALYDSEVDFSSRKGYLDTIVPRLPEYLDK